MLFLCLTFVELLTLGLLFLYARSEIQSAHREELPAKQRLVRRLGLTDFALWTEARYTRHPSQADFFSAFQDFPSSLDHFPAGSIVGPTAGTATAQRR